MKLDSIEEYFKAHPERAFIAKALALVISLKLLESVFYLWWLGILVLAPVLVWCLLRVISIHQDKSFIRVIFENLTLIPAPYIERDSKFQIFPWVTYLLIAVNVFNHYLLIPSLPEAITENLVFVPQDITFLTIPISLFSNMFMHADNWHLGGNMAFLWALGTVLEKRIGHSWLLGLYLASGVAGCLLFLIMGVWVYGYMPSLLGASGAISGLMGIYAVRCYFKTMVFPFPVLGLFSFVVPLNLKVRMNALVVVGLFFWSDLSYGMDELAGIDVGNVAYWCHIGGLLFGMLLAYNMNLEDEAIQEKRIDTARAALNGKDWLDRDVGENAVREYLKQDETDVEALLILAREVSKYSTSEEGRALYQKAIVLLLQVDTEQALSVFREYFNKYLKPLRPDIQFRIAVLAEKYGQDSFASQYLESLLNLEDLGADLHEKCLFHCARLCKKMGLPDAAEMYKERLESFRVAVQ